jgi:hypothetical protein
MIGDICIAILQIAGTLLAVAFGALFLYAFYRLLRYGIDDD